MGKMVWSDAIQCFISEEMEQTKSRKEQYNINCNEGLDNPIPFSFLSSNIHISNTSRRAILSAYNLKTIILLTVEKSSVNYALPFRQNHTPPVSNTCKVLFLEEQCMVPDSVLPCSPFSNWL